MAKKEHKNGMKINEKMKEFRRQDLQCEENFRTSFDGDHHHLNHAYLFAGYIICTQSTEYRTKI